LTISTANRARLETDYLEEGKTFPNFNKKTIGGL